jgi:hypothetical protein
MMQHVSGLYLSLRTCAQASVFTRGGPERPNRHKPRAARHGCGPITAPPNSTIVPSLSRTWQCWLDGECLESVLASTQSPALP